MERAARFFRCNSALSVVEFRVLDRARENLCPKKTRLVIPARHCSIGERVGWEDRVESDHRLGLAAEEKDGGFLGQVAPARAFLFRS